MICCHEHAFTQNSNTNSVRLIHIKPKSRKTVQRIPNKRINKYGTFFINSACWESADLSGPANRHWYHLFLGKLESNKEVLAWMVRWLTYRSRPGFSTLQCAKTSSSENHLFKKSMIKVSQELNSRKYSLRSYIFNIFSFCSGRSVLLETRFWYFDWWRHDWSWRKRYQLVWRAEATNQLGKVHFDIGRRIRSYLFRMGARYALGTIYPL